MSPQGGRSDQDRVSGLDAVHQFIGWGEFTVQAVHPDAGAADAARQGIGNGRRVAVGAGKQQGHRQAGGLLTFPPTAVVVQQTAPTGFNRGTVARRDRADVQFLQTLHQRIHLTGHGCHQAVIEMTAFLVGAAAVGLSPLIGAEMGAEELVAHQQAQRFLEGQQATGPAGGRSWQQQQAALMAQWDRLLLADDPQGWPGRQRRLCGLFSRGGRFALTPQFIDQLGAGVGDHKLQACVSLRQVPQQGDPIGVDVTHHHQQRGIALG